MKRIMIFFVLLFVCNSLVYSANQIQTNLESGTYMIGATTATINLTIVENQTITVFKDTLLFEEDFSNFLRTNLINTSTTIGGENAFTTLPSSMTKMPGCKAQNIKINDTNACTCSIYENTSKFRTPTMTIPNGSKLFVHVKNGTLKSQLTVNDTIFYLKGGADSVKCMYLSNCSFVEFGRNLDKSFSIDDIRIIAPREVVTYVYENNTISLQALTPETKYYIEILNEDFSLVNTYYFTTPKEITDFSYQIDNAYAASLSWTNNDNASNLLLSIDSISNVADDLLISKVANTSNVNIVEIYNPTERDICLENYEFVGYNNGTSLSSNPLRYTFCEKDSIRTNSCIIIALNSKLSPWNSDIDVYPCIYNSNFSGGNDSYLILRKNSDNTYDTIDIFGMLRANPGSYSEKKLIRKPEIIQGVKHNPTNVGSVYNEWNISDYDTSYLNQNLGNHIINLNIGVHNLNTINLNAEQSSIQLNNLCFDGVYRCSIQENNDVLSLTTFRMGKEINVLSGGDWNDANIWQNGLKPTVLDRVVLPQGVKVNIPQNVHAKCAELVISSNYSTCDTTNKTEIRNNGVLSVGKCIVKPNFQAYTSVGNGWTLFGLPIKIENKTREQIAACFDRGEADDLYYLKEDYSPTASAWVPYHENIEDDNFFKQNLGYLVAYSQNKELQWEGTLFFEDELILLNNASYNADGGAGFHLCTNPYPFSVNQNNFSKTNIGGIWLLKPETGQYIPENPNEQSSFMIPPFVGFMTKVNDSENLLKVHKQETVIQAKSSSMIEKLHLNLSYDGGEDDLKIYFREDVTENIDEYDVCKLFSFGSAPDLYSNYFQNNLSIVSLPLWQDSIIIPIIYSAKSLSEYVLKMKNIPENVVRAELYDDNELLIDFVEDSTYNFQTLLNNEERTLTLKLYSFDLNITQEEEMLDFKVIQDKNIVKVISSNEIEELVLYDTKGVKVNESNSNEIIIPNKSCYVLSIKIKGDSYSYKIIYL